MFAVTKSTIAAPKNINAVAKITIAVTKKYKRSSKSMMAGDNLTLAVANFTLAGDSFMNDIVKSMDDMDVCYSPKVICCLPEGFRMILVV